MGQLDESLAGPVGCAGSARDETSDVTHERTYMEVVHDASEALLPWVVRCTWEVLRGLPHPKHTYARRATETAAIDYAVLMMDNYLSNNSLRLVEVHVKGPGRGWEKVQ